MPRKTKTQIITERVAKLDPKQYHAMACLGVARLYEMAEAKGIRSQTAWVKQQLTKLEFDWYA